MTDPWLGAGAFIGLILTLGLAAASFIGARRFAGIGRAPGCSSLAQIGLVALFGAAVCVFLLFAAFGVALDR
jgi:hypothetical protein